MTMAPEQAKPSEVSNGHIPITTVPPARIPPTEPAAQAQPPKRPAGIKAPGWLVGLVVCEAILMLLAVPLYMQWDWLRDFLPATIGGVPIGVVWCGALGAVFVSIYGVGTHSAEGEWDNFYNYWHILRPFSGAIMGLVSYFIYVAVIRAAGSTPAGSTPSSAPQDVTTEAMYYVVAFIVGYREETFRGLLKKATDVLLGPGDTEHEQQAKQATSQPPGPAPMA